MLLNKLPALDKGYVALLSSNVEKIKETGLSFEQVKRQSTVSLIIKCPLFFQMFLSHYDFKVETIKTHQECFIPNETQIGATDLETSRLISDDMKRTTEALLINPSAYKTDGANHFISQVLLPINLYTEIVISGDYRTWMELLDKQNTPEPVEAYLTLIEQIISVEFTYAKT